MANRQRYRDRQIIEAERQANTEVQRQADRQRHRDRHRDRQIEVQRQADRQAKRRAARQRQKGRHINRDTVGEVGRQTEAETVTQRESVTSQANSAARQQTNKTYQKTVPLRKTDKTSRASSFEVQAPVITTVCRFLKNGFAEESTNRGLCQFKWRDSSSRTDFYHRQSQTAGKSIHLLWQS